MFFQDPDSVVVQRKAHRDQADTGFDEVQADEDAYRHRCHLRENEGKYAKGNTQDTCDKPQEPMVVLFLFLERDHDGQDAVQNEVCTDDIEQHRVNHQGRAGADEADDTDDDRQNVGDDRQRAYLVLDAVSQSDDTVDEQTDTNNETSRHERRQRRQHE